MNTLYPVNFFYIGLSSSKVCAPTEKPIMNNIILSLNKFTDKVGQVVSYLSLLLVILIATDVVLRYAFNWTSSANQELEWHLFAALFLLGSGYTLRHDKHVRVDVFYSRFSAYHKAIINFLGSLLFLIPFCSVIVYTSIPFAMEAWEIQESSPEPGGLPHRFIIKSSIPVGAIFLLIQAISLLLSSLSEIVPKPAKL